MKKTYLNPEITIVNVQVAQMIPASTETLGIGEPIDDATGAESRESVFPWEDDLTSIIGL